ncbi:MAG: hypothetical protein FJ020_09895 [Chloroflexi bacterium]|nr:hypothetical protein [Chloroflexota bacterium]
MERQIKPHEPEAELLGPEDVAKDIASLEQAPARRWAKRMEELKEAIGMKTITLEELQVNPAAVLDMADDLLITKDSKPYRLVSRLDEDVLDDVLLLQHSAVRETILTSEANLAAGRYQTVDALLEKYVHELSGSDS